MFALLIFLSLGLTAFVFTGAEEDDVETPHEPENEINGTDGNDALSGN